MRVYPVGESEYHLLTRLVGFVDILTAENTFAAPGCCF